jgi:plasmid stabilization system protein ParE
MEKEIIWTKNAEADFLEIVTYLTECWPQSVLLRFEKTLFLKLYLLQQHPQLGFKSRKFSRFRKTLVTKHYTLIYSVKREHIVLLRLKHVRMK